MSRPVTEIEADIKANEDEYATLVLEGIKILNARKKLSLAYSHLRYELTAAKKEQDRAS